MTQSHIDTDYLIIGAGASGMAIADELVTQTDAEIVLIDRRHQPGGHWVDAYPFVRLHQPSAFYGVNSRPLGFDRIDESGPNAGYYERASGAELVDYYQRVLDEQLLGSGRVRFLGSSEFLGDRTAATAHDGPYTVRSVLDGHETIISARRRVVDATYVESIVPMRHRRPYAAAPETRIGTPTDIVRLADSTGRFTVIGAGKTAMDTCCFLLDQGVDQDSIRWILPRDGWFVDRRGTQPLTLAAGMAEYQADLIESIASSTTGEEFARNFEERGWFLRLDPSVEPAVHRGANVSAREIEQLRSIENTVRLGRVRSISANAVHLEHGDVIADRTDVYVDCTAQGLATSPLRPIFSPGAITVQFTTLGVAPWSASVIGYVESLDIDDEDRNQLCQPVPRTGLIADQLRVYAAGFAVEEVRRGDERIGGWAAKARLNPGRSVFSQMSDPQIAAALQRTVGSLDAANRSLAAHAA
ncbi:MAG: NAD(P)-binding protein [Actinomycetota bacterium]